MDWLVVFVIGAVIGSLFSLSAFETRMPPSFNIAIGIIGALAGAGLERVAHLNAMGLWTFYVAAGVLAIFANVGSILGYSLTRDEKRT